VSSILIGGILFFLSRNSTTVAIENTKVVVKTTADFVLPMVIETLLLVSLFSAAAVLMLTLFISHKISGPLYRFRREIEALRGGDFTRNFNIRGGDQFKHLSQSLSEMCGSLRYKCAALKDKTSTLRGYLEKRDFCVSGDEKEQLTGLLEEISGILKSFKT